MKYAIFSLIVFASFGASATEEVPVGLRFLKTITQQVGIAPTTIDRRERANSCKREGAQCSFHYECCSGFCGRGNC